MAKLVVRRLRRTGDLGGIAEVSVIMMYRIVQVNLLFTDDHFKRFGGQDVAVVLDFGSLYEMVSSFRYFYNHWLTVIIHLPATGKWLAASS